MTTAPDTSLGVPPWRAWLENAHATLERACWGIIQTAEPEADLSPAARRFERAFSSLYDAIDGRTDRVDAVRRAMEEVDGASEELRESRDRDPAVARAIGLLAEVRAALGAGEGSLASAPAALPPAPSPLFASKGVPNLHHVERASLEPRLEFPEPPPIEVVPTPDERPPPRNQKELDERMKELSARAAAQRAAAEERRLAWERRLPEKPAPPVVPEGFSLELPPRPTEDEWVAQRAREHFDEVVLVGLQRAPILGESWRWADLGEKRMLGSIDAIAALGPRAVGSLEALVMDSPARDPTRVFALGITLGCMGGRDALAAAERVFLTTERDDDACRDAFAAALKIAPHPEIAILARTYLGAPSAKHRAMALDVLAYKNLATEDDLLRGAKDDPIVAGVALEALALRGLPSALAAIDLARERPDAPALRPSLFLAMTLAGHVQAARSLREALEGPPLGPDLDRTAILLAIAAEERDAQALLDLTLATPQRALVTALGWTGLVASVPKLIELLGHANKEVVYAAAYALERITGAGLWEAMAMPAEDLDVPEPPTPVVEPEPPKLVRIVSDPRDLPPAPATEEVTQPTTDAGRWKAYWDEKGKDFRAANRYRRGKPCSPAVILHDLDWGPLTPPERRYSHWELVIRTGHWVRFDTHDFIPVQEQAIMEWEPIALRTSGSAGGWGRAARVR